MTDISQPAQTAALPGRGDWRWIVCLLLLALASRLPAIDRPLVGPFATKNTIYAMIARNWALGRAGLLDPTVDMMAGGRRGLHLLELPVSAGMTAVLWLSLGGSLDLWGRLTAVGFSVATVGLLYSLVRRRHGDEAATAAALAMALSPVAVLYGRAFMLEASVAFFLVATLDASDRWAAGRGAAWLAVAAAAWGLMLLTKIYMGLMALPVAAVLMSRRRDRGLAAAAFVLASLPAAAWYARAYTIGGTGHPLSPHVFYSVRQSAADHAWPHPLLAEPTFYLRLVRDLAGVTLTPVWLTLALAAGLHRQRWRYAPWLVSAVLLMLLLPRKFYEMNYYYLPLTPLFCVLAGLGWDECRRRLGHGRRLAMLAVAAAVAFSLRFTIGPIYTAHPEDRGVVAAGAAARRLSAADETVATLHGSSCDLLYYCDRAGWALNGSAADAAQQLAARRREGAAWLVVAGTDAEIAQAKVLAGEPVEAGDGYAVFRLPR